MGKVKPPEGTQPKRVKIAQLCRESGLTRSAIHHYVNIGILHKPHQAGLHLHLYDDSHLARIRQIRHLKEKQGLSLSEIKELLDKIQPDPEQTATAGLAEDAGMELGAWQVTNRTDRPSRNREKILDAAIQLFSEKGYENTKISDITDALHMGRGTFYNYFKNKREVFMECIDRLTVTIVPSEAWEDIRKEQDHMKKLHKRGVAFLQAFPSFRGILNQLRIALGGDDPVLTPKAMEAFKTLTMPLTKDYRRSASDGTLRAGIDEEFAAYFTFVIAEGLGYWLMLHPDYTIEQGLDRLVNLFKEPLYKPPPRPRRPQGKPCSGEVTDRKGMATQLRDILVEDESRLTGAMGEAIVSVDLSKLARARFREKGSSCVAEVELVDGQQITIEVDGDRIVAGRTAFGSFQIPLKSLSEIHICPEEDPA